MLSTKNIMIWFKEHPLKAKYNAMSNFEFLVTKAKIMIESASALSKAKFPQTLKALSNKATFKDDSNEISFSFAPQTLKALSDTILI